MAARSHRIAAGVISIASLLLAGCELTTGSTEQVSAWTKSHRLGDGDVIVTAPSNFCVDRSARPTGSFVLMVNCDVLTDTARTSPNSRGILTVSTSERVQDPTQVIDLASSLGEDSIQSSRVPGLVIRRMTDQSIARLPGAASDHWRGLLQLNNRIVSFAAYGPEGGSVLGSSGRRILENLALETISSSQRETL